MRRAHRAEYGLLGELTLAAYRPFVDIGDAYTEQLRDTAVRDAEAEVWVAEHDGEILGSVTVCPPGSPWREIARDDAEGEFRMLSVAPAAQGRGVGDLLARWTLEELCRRGCNRVAISSIDTMHAAHRLYERLGFTRAPERDWSVGPTGTLIVYERDL